MNSFRSVERAIAFEIERQTRGARRGRAAHPGDARLGRRPGLTYRMRIKESSDDYRYFPEPDLPPLRVDPAWLESIRAAHARAAVGPPRALRRRAGPGAGRRRGHRGRPAAAAVFEGALASGGAALPPRKVANWVTGEYLRLAKGEGGAAAVALVIPARAGRAGTAGRGRRAVGHERQGGVRAARGDRAGRSPRSSAARASGASVTRARCGRAAQAVIDANPAAVADVQAGKVQAIGFLTGQVMKQTRGQADAATVGALLRELLGLA